MRWRASRWAADRAWLRLARAVLSSPRWSPPSTLLANFLLLRESRVDEGHPQAMPESAEPVREHRGAARRASARCCCRCCAAAPSCSCACCRSPARSSARPSTPGRRCTCTTTLGLQRGRAARPQRSLPGRRRASRCSRPAGSATGSASTAARCCCSSDCSATAVALLVLMALHAGRAPAALLPLTHDRHGRLLPARALFLPRRAPLRSISAASRRAPPPPASSTASATSGGVLAGDTRRAHGARLRLGGRVRRAGRRQRARRGVCGRALRPHHQSREIRCMSELRRAPRITAAPELLTVEWADGGAQRILRASGCATIVAEDRDAHSGQRLVDIADLPEQPAHPRRRRARTAACASTGRARRAPALFKLRVARGARAGTARRRPELAVRTWLEGGALDARARLRVGELRRAARASRPRGSRG